MSVFDTYIRARDSALDNGMRARREQQANAQRSALMQAGRAYAGGDFAGAQNVLAESGDLDGAMAMQVQMDRGRREGQAEADAVQNRQRETLIRGAQALRYLPAEQRWATYQARVLPELQRLGFTPDMLAQITAETMDDRSLDSVIALQGGEVQQPRYIQGQRGALDVVSPYTGEISPVREAQRDPPPAGYVWTEGGGLRPIPGGPADPRTIQTNARSRWRPRATGGGGGGAAAPRTYSSSGIQWD